MFKRQDGIAPLLLIPIILGIGVLGWAVVGHHNEANNDNPPAIERPLGNPTRGGPVQPIPEPGSELLFALGLIVTGYAIRRRYDA